MSSIVQEEERRTSKGGKNKLFWFLRVKCANWYPVTDAHAPGGATRIWNKVVDIHVRERTDRLAAMNGRAGFGGAVPLGG